LQSKRRTTDERCPACGKNYRGLTQNQWVFAVVVGVIVLVVLWGYLSNEVERVDALYETVLPLRP
jgi:hypothetical protein